MSTKNIPGHRLDTNGPAGNLSAWIWFCECGAWSTPTPDCGPYGRTSAKARIAQAKMAHGKHAKGAFAKATGSTMPALMQLALEKIGADWCPYPNNVFDRTLKALKRRGLIEERYLRGEGGSGQFQYRRTPTTGSSS